ncbi:hypothetical protein MYX77_06850 [Acidobacteriia bacterium AH_259_A11_L15]|nr:hypothetical protein [Acidobacteriia bacterium AH_259_A11_L15]
MKNGSFFSPLGLLGGLVLLAALPAAAQRQSREQPNCNAYRLDGNTHRIMFNDPRPIIMMPKAEQLETLRAEGRPGQVFRMKNCDAPDVEGKVEVYASPDDSQDSSEAIPSATRVVILEARGKWYKVKGYTSLWKGTGWVKENKQILVVKF